MELAEYVAALRRRWTTWVGGILTGLLLAVVSLLVTPSTYESTAGVFASASPSVPNSAQYVAQRVKSYPDQASSQSVLAPVIAELDLDESISGLRARVSASNPVDTSQVDVHVTGRDAAETTAIANAVARQLTTFIQELETPPNGDRQITLTVTDPAQVPTSPISPVPLYNIVLGVALGALLGMAIAIVRDRSDAGVWTERDVREAWDGATLDVIVPHRSRHRRNTLTGRIVPQLAWRLERAADAEPVSVTLYSPVTSVRAGSDALARGLAEALASDGVSAVVLPVGEEAPPGTEVALHCSDTALSLRAWRAFAAEGHRLVLVLVSGTCERTELHELRTVLETAGVRPDSIVLAPRPRDLRDDGRRSRPASAVLSGGAAAVHAMTSAPPRRAVADGPSITGTETGAAAAASPHGAVTDDLSPDGLSPDGHEAAVSAPLRRSAMDDRWSADDETAASTSTSGPGGAAAPGKPGTTSGAPVPQPSGTGKNGRAGLKGGSRRPTSPTPPRAAVAGLRRDR